MTMDKILEGTLRSDQPDSLKKQLCRKVEELGRTPQSALTVNSILNTTIKIVLNDPMPYAQEACKKIYTVWGGCNRSVLESFFSPLLLQSLLDERVENQKEAIWFIHETMLIIRSKKPPFLNLCKIMQYEAITYITKFPSYETITGFCKFLFDFRDCIPKDEKVMFCNSVISAAGTFEAPKTPELMKQYIKDITHVVGNLLSYIWRDSDQNVIVKSLEQIFSIISHVNESKSPSLALAGIVPNIPIEYVNSIVKQTVSDPNIADENIKEALTRMIDWLTWPGAKNLDTWIIAFFRGLASVHKYTILMEVTETKIEQVYDKLHFPAVRESAFIVLSHMLLSYQHSPEPFHKVVQKVPNTMLRWHAEKSEGSYSLLCRFATLLYTLMSHHLGFPDLYEPVMTALQGLPQPSPDQIKENLAKCSWKANQSRNLNLSASSTFSRRSETGKTGLVNLGNTCYMNSVVQALFMCDSFRQEVLQSTVSSHQPLLAKLQQVFAFLSASQRAAYAPSAFLSASRPPWFTTGLQQDCSEYVRFLYDQLNEHELASLRSDGVDSVGDRTSVNALGNNINDFKDQHSTLISKTFMGRMVTTFKCLVCHNESRHKESFTDLPLAFPENINNKVSSGSRSTRSLNQKAALVGGAMTSKTSNQKAGPNKEDEPAETVVTLEELLLHFLKPEKLEGENKYHCGICKGLQDGERVMHITSAPEYLNLTLLRFAYNVKAKARSKIFTEVTYPKTLRIPVQRAASRAKPGAYTGTRGKIKKSKSDILASTDGHYETYSLNAVIVHSGYSSDSGHYYCYARHSIPVDPTSVSTNQKSDKHHTQNIEDTDFLQDRWYLFNDSRVTYSRYQSFCNVTKTFGKDTAYVLFYKKINHQEGQPMLVDANESIMTSSVDPPLRQDLRAAVDKDNRLFLQEQELQERSRSLQAAEAGNTSFYNNWKDPDDQGPPGSCGGGGGGSGLSTNRLVF